MKYVYAIPQGVCVLFVFFALLEYSLVGRALGEPNQDTSASDSEVAEDSEQQAKKNLAPVKLICSS